MSYSLQFYNPEIHLKALTTIYAHFVTQSYATFDEVPFNEEEMRQRLEAIAGFYPIIVCSHSEHGVVGYAYASKHKEKTSYRWSADISIFIQQGHHRKGLGTALYKTIMDILKLQGICMLHAAIALPNAGSEGLHKSMGFKDIGIYKNVGYKMGSWRDVGWYNLELCPPPVNPKDPISYQLIDPNVLKECLNKLKY